MKKDRETKRLAALDLSSRIKAAQDKAQKQNKDTVKVVEKVNSKGDISLRLDKNLKNVDPSFV